MDEELKGRFLEIRQKYRVVAHVGLNAAILALIVAERDAELENICKWIESDPTYPEGKILAGNLRDMRNELRALESPSTAQSREREIRADELALLNKHLEHNEWASVGSNCCDDYVAARIVELSASSQPKGCTCDRTGWPGSASPELHEVNCPAIKDGRRS